MAKRHSGLGVPNIDHFWKALRLSWFRRAINSESTWNKLHTYKVLSFAFDPVKSNHDSLMRAKSKCKNPLWKEM